MIKKIFLCIIMGAIAQVGYGSEVPGIENPTASETSNAENEKTLIQEFDNVYLTYEGGYSNFDKGFYGAGWEMYQKSGMMLNLSFHMNYGIVDPGDLNWQFGVGYGYPLAKFIAITGRINALLGTGTKYELDDNYEVSTKSTFAYGFICAPGVRLKLSKFIFGVNFNLGWADMGGSGFYKDVELTLGFNI